MYAVIMAGGSGTRFWPLSRETRPKQVLSLTDNEALIQKTAARILPIIKPEDIFIVTIEKQKKIITSLLPHIPSENIIAEPYAKNTAPAIGLAALHIRRKDPDGVMAVLPADHLIKNVKKFCQILKQGEKIANECGSLIALGMKPHYPETGFGYIQAGTIKTVKGLRSNKTRTIKRFTEKPKLPTAKKFVARDDYYWNGGIFVWKSKTILDEIQSNIPEIYKGLQEIDKFLGKRGEKKKTAEIYNKFLKISIDNGVMEKTDKGVVIPSDIGWNDVGSWLALEDLTKSDKNNNSIIGKCIHLDSKDCIVHSPNKMVALIGVKDLIVVNTPDAVLVCTKKNSQKVKDIVEELKKSKQDRYL